MRSEGERRPVGREEVEARFERLYADHGRSVLAYAVRRASDGQDAADVVADTFLVAWRRLDDVPPGEAARLWLYGVARNMLANQQRSERRRQRLGERLRQELPVVLEGVGAPAQTGAVSAALARLGPDDQEILRLAAWEELSPGEIAVVLGIGQVAVRVGCIALAGDYGPRLSPRIRTVSVFRRPNDQHRHRRGADRR